MKQTFHSYNSSEGEANKMFSVPSISTLSNSIEAAIVSQPAVHVRSVDLRRSDKVGLTNYLRHEYNLRGATVSIGHRSVTVYLKNVSDTHAAIEAVREFSKENSYTVSKSTKRFSVKKFLQAVKH